MHWNGRFRVALENGGQGRNPVSGENEDTESCIAGECFRGATNASGGNGGLGSHDLNEFPLQIFKGGGHYITSLLCAKEELTQAQKTEHSKRMKGIHAKCVFEEVRKMGSDLSDALLSNLFEDRCCIVWWCGIRNIEMVNFFAFRAASSITRFHTVCLHMPYYFSSTKSLPWLKNPRTTATPSMLDPLL